MSDNCRDLFFTETTATALGTYSAYIGDGVNTTYNITHNLNSEKVTYSLRDVQTDVLGYAQVNVTGPDTVTISFDDPPALTAFYLTVFASITAKQVTGFEDRITVNVTQPVQDISVNVADTSDVILVSPQQDVITISTSVQSVPGVTIDVGVVDTQEQINVAVDTAATAWGTIIGTLSTQTDLWKYLSAVGTSNFDIATLNNYLSTNNILLCSLNVNGQILSADIPLHDIFLTTEAANWPTQVKILNELETVLNASLYGVFVKTVSSNQTFTYSNFVSGQTIAVYLSANHSDYLRHYFPDNTIIQKAGEYNAAVTFNNTLTRITIQNIGEQYIGIANVVPTEVKNTQNYISLDSIFGFLLQEDDYYLLQE